MSWSSATAKAARRWPRRWAASASGSCLWSGRTGCTEAPAPTWAAYRRRHWSTTPTSADRRIRATVVYDKDGHEHSVAADAILAATGRAPATRDLALEAAGVRTTERGGVEVDGFLRTSQPHIYALGDVNGGPQFTYISLDDSRIVLDQLIGEGKRSTADRVAIPHTLFMTPPLATVGLTEKEARAAGHRVKIASQPVAEIIAMPRAYIVEDPRGVMKFVLDADTDDILGAALLSIDAQELINTVALAMRHGVKAAELRDAVYQHSTSTEAFNDVLATIVRAD